MDRWFSIIANNNEMCIHDAKKDCETDRAETDQARNTYIVCTKIV